MINIYIELYVINIYSLKKDMHLFEALSLPTRSTTASAWRKGNVKGRDPEIPESRSVGLEEEIKNWRIKPRP